MNPRLKKGLQAGVSLLLVGLIFWYVQRQFADLSSVWVAFKTLTTQEMAILAAFTVWNLVTYWVVIVLATPGLTYPQAAVMTQATTAVSNSMPAGGAIGVGLTYTMLSSWGFSKSRGSLSVIVTGIWNNFVKLGTPILALAIVALQGQPSGGRLVAAGIGIVGLAGAVALFGLILRSEAFAAKSGIVLGRGMSALRKLVRRGPVTGWDLAVTKFRGRVIELVHDRWIRLTLTTILSHASLFVVLLICLRTMGVSEADVGWAQVLTVFAFARLVTAIPLTPGGLGVVELALIAGIIRGGGNEAPVVAAVLLYRLLTYVLPILLGGISYIYWRQNKSWIDSAPPLVMTDEERSRRARPAVIPAERRRRDVIGLVAGGALFALVSVVVSDGLIAGEEPIFSAINSFPGWFMIVIWPFMQYGVFVTIPVLTLIALFGRRFRLAAGMATSGVGVYFLARLVKEVVQRGRPAGLIAEVEARENFSSTGIGFPSGHIAVAAALTVVVTPYLRGRWKYVPAALAVIVCIGRMYVGAHVPLDLVGGAALGVLAGSIANLVIGVPRQPHDVDDVINLDDAEVPTKTAPLQPA
jgi:uncharacterized protein (TIRG00374 family)